MEDAARDRAEKQMQASKEEAGIISRIWKHDVARNVYLRREIAAAREEIQKSGNLYRFAPDSRKTDREKAHQEAMGAVVERFLNETDDLLHKEAGEKKEILGTEGEPVKERIATLIKDFATGRLSEENFAEERTRVLAELRGIRAAGTERALAELENRRDTMDKKQYKAEKQILLKELLDLSPKARGEIYADNLFAVAKQVKDRYDHGEKLEEMDLDFDLVIGEAKAGVRTEAHFDRVDRILDKMQKTRVGSYLANETAVATIYATTVGLVTRGAQSAARLLAPIGSAVVAGGVAGLREKKRFKEDRRTHARERAQGEQLPDDAPRRLEMEGLIYESRGAEDLRRELESVFFEVNKDGQREARDLTQDEFDRALAVLADVNARVSLSDKHKLDLISYSHVSKVEKERLELDKLRALTRVHAGKLLKGEIKLKKDGTEFEYGIEGLVSPAEIKHFTENNPEYKAATEPKEKEALLSYWIYERRIAKGFTVPEIEAHHGTFNAEASREYANWDHARTEEAHKALAGVKPGTEKVLGKDLRLPEGKELPEFLRELSETRGLELARNEISKKDALFKKMERKHVTTAVMKGLLTGLVVGAAVQEIGSFFQARQEGLVEDLIKGHQEGLAPEPVHFTPLEFLRRWAMGDLPKFDPAKMHEIVLGNTSFKMPDGTELIQNPDHTVTLVADGQPIAEHLTLDAHNNLTPDAQHILSDKGIHLTSEKVLCGPEGEASANTLASNKLEGPTEINRHLWYDNDTPMHADPKTGKLLGADWNELKLQWGEKGVGVNPNGDYIMSAGRMTPDGSWHQQFSTDAQNLMHEGKMKLLLSASRATQKHVWEFTMDQNGNVIIPKNSDAAKLLFETDAHGKAVFKGAFAEVGQYMDTDKAGEHFKLLATHVGKGLEAPPLPPPVDCFTNVFDVPRNYRVDLPYIIPFGWRTPLEPTIPEEPPLPPYLYEHSTSEDQALMRDRRSKTLNENPRAKLDHFAETETYIQSFSPEYRKRVESLAGQVPPMSERTKLAVCIPVAGHQEGKNIYQSLESYTYQTAAPEEYELVLFVNHPEKERNDKQIKPDETLSEIERFQKDHPEIPVRVIYSALPLHDANMGTIRKLLNDSVLLRNHARGNKAPDLIMVSNDADNKGISPDYVKNFIEKFEKNPDKDAFMGQLDWDPEAYVQYPLIMVGVRLFQYLDLIQRKKFGRLPSSGANFAFRSSIYSAIGGYAPETHLAEDVAFGRAIKEGRKNVGAVGYGGARVSRLYTSARRAVDAFKSGRVPYEQWANGFGAFDDEIRKFSLSTSAERVNYRDPQEQMRLKEGVEKVINRTLDLYAPKIRKNSPDFCKAIGLLGIKYTLDSKGDAKISDISMLVRGLEKYQNYGVALRDAKSAKPGAKERLHSLLENTGAVQDLPLRATTQNNGLDAGDVLLRR